VTFGTQRIDDAIVNFAPATMTVADGDGDNPVAGQSWPYTSAATHQVIHRLFSRSGSLAKLAAIRRRYPSGNSPPFQQVR
jgi:hypothetical protein